jgi:hypothetical protein
MLKISNIVYLTIVFFIMKHFKLFNVIDKTTKVKDKTYSMGAIFGSLILGAYLLEKAINELLDYYPSLPRLPSFMYDNLEGHSLFNQAGDEWSTDQPQLYVSEDGRGTTDATGVSITIANSCPTSTDPELEGVGICPPLAFIGDVAAPDFVSGGDRPQDRAYTGDQDATLEDGTPCCHPGQVQGFLLQRLKPYHEVGRGIDPGAIGDSVDNFPDSLTPLYYVDDAARNDGPEYAIQDYVPSDELMNRYRDPSDTDNYIPLPGELPDDAYIYCPPGNVCQEDPDNNRLTPYRCYSGEDLTEDTYEDCTGEDREWRQGNVFSWNDTGPQQQDATGQVISAGYEVGYLLGNQQGEPLAGNQTHVDNLGLEADTVAFTPEQIRWYSNRRNQGPDGILGERLYNSVDAWLQYNNITCRPPTGSDDATTGACNDSEIPLEVKDYITTHAGSAREANLIATSYCNYPPTSHQRCAGPDYTEETIPLLVDIIPAEAADDVTLALRSIDQIPRTAENPEINNSRPTR